MKLALLLVGLILSAAFFFTLDWFHSAAIRKTAASTGKRDTCRVRDPIRHHAFKPNCASIEQWGRDSYDFFTNDLGFRDDTIREVPLSDARPRILMLGDSFTEGGLPWRDCYVGRVAEHFPQYDFLNGGVASYSPSNYLNVARMVLAKGVEIDEVIVFIDMSDVQDEAAFYRDIDPSGAVTGPERVCWTAPWSAKWRFLVATHLVLTNYLFEFFERHLVGYGFYHVALTQTVSVFDREGSAWTYRKVNETDPYPAGYAPLGVERGIAKEMAKMNLLWQELEKRDIPISVVVYPWPAQLLHDPDSKQVRIWRDWCEDKCKRFISLVPAFFAVKGQCPRIKPGCWYLSHFIFGDFHYNAAGNALVADEVIRNLAAEPPAKRLGANLRPEPGEGLGAH